MEKSIREENEKKQSFCFLFIGTAIALSAQTLDEATKLTENEQYKAATEVYKMLISKDPWTEPTIIILVKIFCWAIIRIPRQSFSVKKTTRSRQSVIEK